MSDFDGYRLTVVSRIGTSFSATHLDLAAIEIGGIPEDVLPLGDARALLISGGVGRVVSWNGEELSLGTPAVLDVPGEIQLAAGAVTTDRTAAALVYIPTAGGDPRLRIFPVTATGIGLGAPTTLTVPDSPTFLHCYALGENELLVLADQVLRRTVVTDGTPAWATGSYTIPADWTPHVVERTVILTTREPSSQDMLAMVLDVEGWTTGEDQRLAVPYHGWFRSLGEGRLLVLAVQPHAEDEAVAALTAQPVSIVGTDITLLAEPRVIALSDGYGLSTGRIDVVGEQVVGVRPGVRTDRESYAPDGGVDYQLSEMVLFAQALGYLDGTGHEDLDDMEPAADASQLWNIDWIIPLDAAENPNLSVSLRDARALFYPI